MIASMNSSAQSNGGGGNGNAQISETIAQAKLRK